MIRSISLRNFQSHKRTLLDKLSPGVNIIVGQSDSGKTAIVRALKWLWCNRPIGSAFIRHGKSRGSVALVTLPNRIHIVREKGKGINEYRIRTLPIPHAGTKPTIFEAVNTGIPEEVDKVLDLKPINFQQQLDAPFLLGLSPSDVARQLNDAAGLGDIDRVFGNLRAMKRRTDDDLRNAAQDRQEAEEDLSKMPDMVKTNDLMLMLKDKKACLDAFIERRNNLESLQEQIGEARAKIKKLSKWTKAKEEVDKLGHELGRLQILQKKYNALQVFRLDLEATEKCIKEWMSRKNKLETEWHRKMPNVCPLCGRKG